jgi:multiple sugar transport system permease protein
MSPSAWREIERVAPARSRGLTRLETSLAKARHIARRTALYLIIAALGLAFSAPFLWMVSSSLKTERQIYRIPPVWIPNPAQWSNYPEALTFIPFFRFIGNTLFIMAASLPGPLIACSLVAYGFSRLRWPGRDTVFFICLSTMMIPYPVTMVPLYIIFQKMGWIGTYKPLIVPTWFATSPMYIFLLRQFFMTIPAELSDAARIDGCSEPGIYLRIILPLAKPALAVVTLFHFGWAWNDFMGPLIYLNDRNMYTIALGLSLFNDLHHFQFALQMAASTVATLPMVLMFFLAQRTFIEGISLTGIKG